MAKPGEIASEASGNAAAAKLGTTDVRTTDTEAPSRERKLVGDGPKGMLFEKLDLREFGRRMKL